MAPPTRPVTEIQIGGIAYRVQSTADTTELSRLAALVEARLADLPASQRQDHRSLVLVALSLAHDLEQERAAHQALRASTAQRLTGLITRIDDALDHRDENGAMLPPIPCVAAAPAVPVPDASGPPPGQPLVESSADRVLHVAEPRVEAAARVAAAHIAAAHVAPDLSSHATTTSLEVPTSLSSAPQIKTVAASRSRKPQPKSQTAHSDATDSSPPRDD